ITRKVVGWSLDRTMAGRLAMEALEKAIAMLEPLPGLVHHSDRGAVRQRGIRSSSGEARLDSQHEPPGKSLRQCKLRKLSEDVEAGGNLREPVQRLGTFAHKHRGIYRAI